MIKEFKEFISKGNVMDLAVGVVIGSAFGKIVSSLVDNIIMPLVGMLIGGIDFSSLSIKLGNAKILYGVFLQNVVDFLIVAFCLFMVVKFMNKLNKIKDKVKKQEEKKEETKKDPNLEVLEEIRDLLKKNNKKATK